MPINVMPYDPAWPERFDAERALLEDVLAPWLSGGVHHIGSTSVPDLHAKPIIDMIAGVRDLAEASAAIDVLASHSYAHAPHRPRAYWLYKPSGPGSRAGAAGEPAADATWRLSTHGLHLTEPGSDLWRERLAFRDALRRDPALRDEYQELKLRLAAAHDELAEYTADKRAFVARVLAAEGIALAPR
ncbi:MAG: GrpB family protein [Micromonosporaceae bacterium]